MSKKASKSKKKGGKRPQQTQNRRPQPKQQNDIIPVKQGAGVNRQVARLESQRPTHYKSSRPLWIRILIVVVMVVMVLGFFIVPLMASR